MDINKENLQETFGLSNAQAQYVAGLKDNNFSKGEILGEAGKLRRWNKESNKK